VDKVDNIQRFLYSFSTLFYELNSIPTLPVEHAAPFEYAAAEEESYQLVAEAKNKPTLLHVSLVEQEEDVLLRKERGLGNLSRRVLFRLTHLTHIVVRFEAHRGGVYLGFILINWACLLSTAFGDLVINREYVDHEVGLE
jgi:hypothetical protein